MDGVSSCGAGASHAHGICEAQGRRDLPRPTPTHATAHPRACLFMLSQEKHHSHWPTRKLEPSPSCDDVLLRTCRRHGKTSAAASSRWRMDDWMTCESRIHCTLLHVLCPSGVLEEAAKGLSSAHPLPSGGSTEPKVEATLARQAHAPLEGSLHLFGSRRCEGQAWLIGVMVPRNNTTSWALNTEVTYRCPGLHVLPPTSMVWAFPRWPRVHLISTVGTQPPFLRCVCTDPSPVPSCPSPTIPCELQYMHDAAASL